MTNFVISLFTTSMTTSPAVPASEAAARRVAVLSSSGTWSLSASARRMLASAAFTAALSRGGH
ncbi:MAG: hypothetical protein ACYDHH_33655 [Solirubrobacteraceae bacterium]